MRRNRTMAAILGSLALVLFISSPVFAEGEADSGTPTSAEVVAPETPAEPETPPSTPDTPEPETPAETPVSGTPDSSSASSSSSGSAGQESSPSSNSSSSSSNNSSSSNRNDTIERPENNNSNNSNSNRSSSSNRSNNTSKSNNTRLSSVKFAGHEAVLSDGIFLVADPSIDIRDKTKITLKAENSSAKAEVVDQKIEDENTAIYTIKVTAENGKTRDYTLRVIKGETKSAATTTTAAAASSTGSTTDNTGAKKGNALAKFLFIFGFMAVAGVFAAFLVIRDYKKKNGIDDDLPFSDDDNNIRYKKALAWRRIPESTDARLGRRGMPEEIPEDVLNELRGK